MMIEELISNGYISKRKHPEEELFILNYTPKTQYESLWNEFTLSCRGLIVDSSYNIKARCFKKFFNYEEARQEISSRANLAFDVQEKIDGSLGILYWIKDKPFISTRGSFDSKQALVATEILHSYGKLRLDESLTYLFEIVYPENRICVDYGTKRDLIFLSAFDIQSGKEVKIKTDFPSCQSFSFDKDFDSIKKLNWPNKEGFVVRFEDGFRFKIKFDEYVNLHNVIFSISSKSIWDCLRNKKDLPLDLIPDETYKWVKQNSEKLKTSYLEIESSTRQVFQKIQFLPRKEFAIAANEYKYPSILFKMLDNRPYSDIIWKIIEPEYKRPNDEKIQEGS
jgi:RNA ligase